jgi:hypothetical protein
MVLVFRQREMRNRLMLLLRTLDAESNRGAHGNWEKDGDSGVGEHGRREGDGGNIGGHGCGVRSEWYLRQIPSARYLNEVSQIVEGNEALIYA